MLEIVQKYEIHPNMVKLWKKHLIENATLVFERNGKKKVLEEAEKKIEELFSQMGQLKVEMVT